jgi:hypothetical protein
VQVLGFPSWRTIQGWRQDLMDQMGLKDDLFDGSDENLMKLFELIQQVRHSTGHPQYMKGSVACDVIAASSGVSVGEDSTVTGLKVPLKLSPEEAHPLLDRRGEAFLRLSGKKLQRASLPATCM